MSSVSEIDLLIEICEDFFQQRSYEVKRGPPLHQHVRWRPEVYAVKNHDNIALDVRITDSIPQYLRNILKGAMRLLPDVRIYVAIPAKAKSLDTYVKQTKSLGIGLFTIDGTILREKIKPRKPKRNFVSTPSGKRAQAIILRPGSRYAAWLELGQVLADANQFVKVVDPYCDEVTLQYLLRIKKSVEIELITAFSGSRQPQEPVFQAACHHFKLDYPRFEACKCNPRAIHDRWVITENETWMLGPSVKDAGLRFGCLARIEDVQAKIEIDTFFDGIWNDPNTVKIV